MDTMSHCRQQQGMATALTKLVLVDCNDFLVQQYLQQYRCAVRTDTRT